MNRHNFIKDNAGGIVAIDFGATGFLPSSFFAYALRWGDNFTQLIAKKIKHPPSTQLEAMLTAYCALVPFGTNNIGEQCTLQGDRAQCTPQAFPASSGPSACRHGAQAVSVLF